LGTETRALESGSAEAEAARRRCDARLEELERALDDSRRETENLLRQRDGLTRRLEHLTARLEESAEQIDALCRQRNLLHDDLTERRERHSGAVERAALLEDLIRRHDGIGEGVRNVLARAANPKDVFHRNLFGLTADALQAGVDMAPLIEIALGPAAQHVAAVFDAEFLQALRAESPRLGGRVGFIPLDSCPAENDSSSTADSASEFIENATPKPAARDSSSAGAADEFPEGRPGVVGRADRFVETSPQCAALAERLLGRTWIVENLDYALQFARSVRGGYNFVTLAGERLDADGTLMIGPRDAAGGLIARRSQLRAIQAQLVESQAAIEAVQNALGALDEQIDARRRQVEQWSAEHREASEALAENRVALTTADERRNQFQRQQSVLEAERSEADARLAEVRLRLDEARGQRARLDAELRELEGNLSEIGRRMDGLENRRQTAGRETTEIKVELAQCEERLRNLQARMKQFEESRQERRKALDDAVGHLADCARRADDSQWKILQAEAEVAALYLAKENVAGQIVALAGRREAMQEQRTALAAEIQHLQSSIRKLEERIHAVDLAANEVRHERNALADRLREDYGTELAELDRRPSNDEEQRRREEVQREIEELRGKLNSLGNVNLEALAELEELEKRFQTLSDQRNDLTSAKASLESIIARIDDDSRRLFSETLEVVKGHFQTLFRDLFGGGRADIVLEENVDILESGSESVARPPGKEPRSISLLSGGEKTLTCAALLLAIFRSRPSPFCVLDEVDAALDDANIARFTQVLKDFLAWTQFIIVTHSKKTMTCANTIYGVTMQESGVSKQVSVRFEDVSADGRILGGAPDESRSKAA